MYDLGDVASSTFYTRDASGALAAPGALPTATVTYPDGSTAAGTVTLTATGTYRVDSAALTQAGRSFVVASWTAGAAVVGKFTDVWEVDDPTLLPVVSLADIKARLSLSTTTPAQDDLLRTLVAEATDMVERYLNRAVRRQTVVETYDGGGTSVTLFTPPVISITTVTENGTTLSASDYTLDAAAGILYRGSAIARFPFFPGRQNIVVTYVAGYANPPLTVQRVVKDVAAWLWQTTQQGSRPGFGQSANDTGYGADAIPAWLFRPVDSLRLPGLA